LQISCLESHAEFFFEACIDRQVTIHMAMRIHVGRQDKNEKCHRTESFYGSFERRFSLPDNVNSEAICCESKDGVLTVHIPKTEAIKSKPKHIAVQ